MPNVKKQKIDLSILFYNCIFTISNTQKEYKYFFIQSYNCVDDDRLYYARKHNYQVICPEFIQYCIKNSIM